MSGGVRPGLGDGWVEFEGVPSCVGRDGNLPQGRVEALQGRLIVCQGGLEQLGRGRLGVGGAQN